MNNDEVMEIDLLEILHVLRQRILIIIIAAVVGAGLLGVYSFFIAKPVYQSTAKIYILSQSTSLTSFADIQISSSLALDYEQMITSRPVIRQVKQNLRLPYDYKEIVDNMVSVNNPQDTRILEVSCKSTDPKEAANMANELALVSKRQIADIMDTDEPTIFERAIVEPDPIKPEKAKNILIGFLLGAILAAAVVIIRNMLNDSIRTEDDIKRSLNINVLATIPYEKGIKRGENK